MASYLQSSYGHEWRGKLPSQPKGPGFTAPAYTPAAASPSPSQQKPVTTPPQQSPQKAKQSKGTGTPTSPVQTTPAAVQVPPTPAQAPPTGPSSKTGVSPSHQANGVHPSNKGTPAAAAKAPSPSPTPGATPKTSEEKPRELSKEEKFQEFKAQGNEFVKKGQYSPAIACYTRCIEVDATQAVSYCNRALCYLKINLPEDAIKDCDEALQRDPRNVKALYRRAQARKLLANYQESAQDLMDLLKLEPTNAPAKKELDLVKDAWRKYLEDLREQQSKSSQETSQGRTSGESEESKKKKKAGKRIQIQEVNDSSEEDSRADTPKSNTTTPHPGNLKNTHSKSTSSPAAEKSTTTSKTKDSKGGKENKPSSGSNTSNGIPHAKKMTAYEFMQEWTSLKRRKNEEGYASLLKQVQPSDIPKVLSNKLDGDMLSKILSASANHLVDQDASFTFQLLSKLRAVDRFRTMTMFLTKMDKANVLRCINRLSSNPDVCKEEDLKKLKKAFNL